MRHDIPRTRRTAIDVHLIELVVCAVEIDAAFPGVVFHRADDHTVPRGIVVERRDLVADRRAVEWFRVVANKMVIVERDTKGAIVVRDAEIHSTRAVHHDRADPIHAETSSFHRRPHQEVVSFIEREILFHRGKTRSRCRHGGLIASRRPAPTGVLDTCDIIRAHRHPAVKSGDFFRVLPKKVRCAGGQIILQPDVAIRHGQQIADLLKKWSGEAGAGGQPQPGESRDKSGDSVYGRFRFQHVTPFGGFMACSWISGRDPHGRLWSGR